VRIDERLLDRLVDGELDEAARAELLRSLDANPECWRQCALAFLEAQTWGGALNAPRQEIRPPRQIRPLRLGGQFAAIAAAVIVAFMTGFAARNASVSRPDLPVVPPPATVSVVTTTPDVEVAAPGQSTLPDYVRRQLERQGYEVEGNRKTVSVALKDGRQLAVPVETYKYRFVGHRLY
jgi:hypothetical protein